MKRLVWRLQVWGFYLASLLIAVLPFGLARRLGEGVGLLMYHLLASRRRIAEENIANSLEYLRAQPGWGGGETTPEELVRTVFLNLGRSLAENCRLYRGCGNDLIDGIEVRGREHYEAARAKGKGLIFLTGHCGNWELVALAYSRLFNSSISVVARRQNNPFLNEMVEKMRMNYDNLVIYKDNALRNMISVIRSNGTIGLLVDQTVLPEEGVLIPFLGRMAWASKAPVLLSRKTGVPILPAFIHRENGRHIITIHPEIGFAGDNSDAGMAADVKRYSEHLERFIVEHPADWYWVHRRWKRAGEPQP